MECYQHTCAQRPTLHELMFDSCKVSPDQGATAYLFLLHNDKYRKFIQDNLTVTDEAGNTVLHWACMQNNDQLVAHLLSEDYWGMKFTKETICSLFVANNEGNYPQHIAAEKMYSELLSRLIFRSTELGNFKDVLLARNASKKTLLHISIYYNCSFAILSNILQALKDFNNDSKFQQNQNLLSLFTAQDENGDTFLHLLSSIPEPIKFRSPVVRSYVNIIYLVRRECSEAGITGPVFDAVNSKGETFTHPSWFKPEEMLAVL